MRNRAHHLNDYVFSPVDSILLDANVWLYLHPAPSNTGAPFAGQYSAAMKRMLIAGARLVLDPLVLSEYVNRYVRIEWEARYRAVHPKFKNFRRSADFPPVGQAAAAFSREILKLCARQDHPFASMDLAQILADFEIGAQDLNDGLLAETCRQHGWKFVTNDGDCTRGGIEVLTTNPKLIAACR